MSWFFFFGFLVAKLAAALGSVIVIVALAALVDVVAVVVGRVVSLVSISCGFLAVAVVAFVHDTVFMWRVFVSYFSSSCFIFIFFLLLFSACLCCFAAVSTLNLSLLSI